MKASLLLISLLSVSCAVSRPAGRAVAHGSLAAMKAVSAPHERALDSKHPAAPLLYPVTFPIAAVGCILIFPIGAAGCLMAGCH